MTIAVNDVPASGRPARRAGLIAAAGAFLSLVARSIEAARAYEVLSQMTDAELARRGLARADIAAVAKRVLLDDE